MFLTALWLTLEVCPPGAEITGLLKMWQALSELWLYSVYFSEPLRGRSPLFPWVYVQQFGDKSDSKPQEGNFPYRIFTAFLWSFWQSLFFQINFYKDINEDFAQVFHSSTLCLHQDHW